MIRKLKSFWDKEHFDYSEGLVNPYEFHPSFYWFSRIFLVIDTEPLERKFKFLRKAFFFTSILAIFLTSLCAYNACKVVDILIWTQVVAYIILFVYTLMILISINTCLRHYQSLQKVIRDDFFYICTEGQRYRDRFFKSQLETWKLCVACFFFTFLGVILAIFTLLLLFFYLVTHDPTDENDPGRPLLFPIWFFDISPTESPAYEFFFSFTTWTTVMIGFVYNFMKQNEVTWVRAITTRADIIIYAIEDLKIHMRRTNDPERRKRYEDSLKKDLTIIVKRHLELLNLLAGFAEVYRKMLLYEQKLGGPLMCLCAYVSTELLFKRGEVNPVLFILFVAAFSACFIPSYMCTFLGDKLRSIGDACWSTPFWDASPVIRPYMVLLMQRSFRPLPLQAPGFAEVSLETFASTISAAYSMFNMLRQTDIGNIQ